MRRALLLSPLLFATFALAADVYRGVRVRDALGLVVGRGTCFQVQDRQGRPADVPVVDGRMVLERGARLLLSHPDGVQQVRFLALGLDATAKVAPAYVAADGRRFRVEVSLLDAEAKLVEERDDLPDLPQNPTSLAIEPKQETEFLLRFDDEEDVTRLLVGGQVAARVPRAQKDRAWIGARDGPVAVRGIVVTTLRGEEVADPVRALRPLPVGAIALDRALPFCLAHLIAAAFLAALSRSWPGAWRLGFATLSGMVPFHLHLATRAFGLAGSAWWLLLAPLSAPVALFLLRRHLGPRDTPPPRWTALVGPAVAGSAVAAIAVAMLGHLEERGREERLAVLVEDDPLSPANAPPYRLAEPRILTAVDDLSIQGSYRDFVLDAEVSLGEGSVLEIRARAAPSSPTGAGVFLSAHPGFESGIYAERHDAFERRSQEEIDPLPQNEPVAIRLVAKGRAFSLAIGGEETASGTVEDALRGAFDVLAARGEVTVRRLAIQPVPCDLDDIPAPWRRASAAVVSALGSWLALALCLAFLLGVGFPLAARATAFHLVPIALAVGEFSEAGALPAWKWAAAAAASAFVLILPSVAWSESLGPLRFAAWFGLAVAGAGGSVCASTLPPAFPDSPQERTKYLNERTYVDGCEGAIDPDFLHLRHPLIRRFNGYLDDHRFRGRAAAKTLPPGRKRVVCLGSSSTYGYRLPEHLRQDYPARLEDLLRQDGHDVEVLNAAWSGATATRLLWFMRNAIVPLRPDVVTLSVYYNDSVVLSQGDEGAWFDLLAGGGPPPGIVRGFLERARIQRERGVLAEVMRAYDPEARPSTLDLWTRHGGDAVDHPAARFERTLRRFAALAREHGIALILIKEAVAGNRNRIWKDEFRAAMDRVASDEGLPLCDPSYVLLQAERRLEDPIFMDEVHLEPTGCSLMAWSLRPYVEQALEAP